jgi:organic radical activating enzyme
MLLPIAEHFYSLQGEGFYSGIPAYFIRLAGCNVGCAWCDSKETWNVNKCEYLTIDEIISQLQKTPARIAIITGGEPLLYGLNPLCGALKQAGIATHLETSGTQPMSGQWDWLAMSPKKHAPPLKACFPFVNELKVVICHAADFAWAADNAALCMPHCHLFLQPEWENRRSILPLIVEYIKCHPQWRLSLQIHKFVGIK